MPELDQQTYYSVRNDLLDNSNSVALTEEEYTEKLTNAIRGITPRIISDFDQAIALKPFWTNYPPQQRGRAPTGESIPWLEVGEKVITPHVVISISSAIAGITYPGLPSGSDIRFMTEDALIHLDIKITGPNDRADEIVASPNQLSGDGVGWENGGMTNSPVSIQGQRSTMQFQPELSPFYIYRRQPLLCLTFFLKGVYTVRDIGDQPLDYLELVCVPNGLLSFTGPNYNSTMSGLFIPGKDQRDHPKKRTRVRLGPLAELNSWRRVRL